MGMTEEKTTRELVYETNRDVKWICKMLARMEAQDEEFEARLRALEGWRAEKAGEERRLSTVSAGAGGVVGGVVAVIVKVLGGGWGTYTSTLTTASRVSRLKWRTVNAYR
jgi:hypothetical protein